METSRTVKWPLKVWFVLHVALITLWCLPQAPPAVRAGRIQGGPVDSLLAWNDNSLRRSPVRYYLTSTGLWQYWDMFAPDPLKADYFLEADIQYSDGTAQRKVFPRMALMPIWERYLRERYRKYVERAHSEESSYLWEPMARWMARRADVQPDVRPTAVNLILRVRFTPPPTPNLDPNRPFDERVFFAYTLKPGDLEARP